MSTTPIGDGDIPPLSNSTSNTSEAKPMSMPTQLAEGESQSSPILAPTISSTPDVGSKDLESQLRGMILSNGVPSYPKPSNDQVGVKPMPSPSNLPPHLRAMPLSEQEEYMSKHCEAQKPASLQRLPYKKPNQAQRRKLPLNHGLLNQPPSYTLSGGDEITASCLETSSISSQRVFQHPMHQANQAHKSMQSHPNSSRSSKPDISRTRQPPQQTQFDPHYHERQHATHQLSDGVHQSGQTRSRTSMPLPYQHAPRPYPQPFQAHHNKLSPDAFTERSRNNQNRQLFDPRSNTHGNVPFHHAPSPRFQHNFAPVRMQVDYLNNLASIEVPIAEIKSEDLIAKERLRLTLEQICRESISVFEKIRDPTFDPNTVGLKCFGSLSSGFATYSSDMDLVLVSPATKPDVASTESGIPRLLEKALLDRDYGARLLTRTRVPIIKFCEKPTNQLAEAMLKERAKWEETKSQPNKPKKGKKAKATEKPNDNAKPKKRKKPGKSKKGKVSHMGGTSEVKRTNEANNSSKLTAADSILGVTQNSANTETGSKDSPVVNVGTDSISDPTLSGTTNNSKEDRDQNLSEEAEDSDTSSEEKQLEINDAIEGSSTKLVPSRPHGDAIEGESSSEVTRRNIDEKEMPTNAEILEEKGPPIRSDDELVRLYQLAIQEDWFDNEERIIISHFVKAVEGSKHGQTCPELIEARTALQSLPDVLKRYRDKKDELEIPKIGVGIQCDINFSNELALHNTHMLRCYSHCDPRIRPMVLFVKAWAKRRKTNSPYTGTLSSYGYVLMVLHFAVNVADPPLAPNLQLSGRIPPTCLDSNVTMVNGYNVRFWRSEKEIRDCAARETLTKNRESVGSLLRNFFQYFAIQGPKVIRCGFSWSTDVLSLRTHDGLLSKKDKGWTGAKITTIEPTAPGQESKEVKHRYLFAIEDPFEIDHNIARTVTHPGIVAIRDEFRRANRIIQHAGFDGGEPVYLLQEVKETPSPRTFFGPHPRPVFGPPNLAEELRPVIADEPSVPSPPSPPPVKPLGDLTGYMSPASEEGSDQV